MMEITREKLCNVMRYLILFFTFVPYFIIRIIMKIKIYFRRIFFYKKKFSKMFKSNKRIRYKRIFRPQIIYVIFSFNKGKDNFGFMHYEWENTCYEYDEYDCFMEKGFEEYTKDDLEETFDYDKYEDKTTKEDEQNRIIRIDVTAENWEENKLLAKGMGIEIDEPKYVECVVDLKN